MIPDLRRRLVSKLRAAEDCTDAQLIAHAGHVVSVNDRLWDLLKRSRTPVRKPWAAVGIGDYVVERDTGSNDLALWTVHGRFPGYGEDTEIMLKMTDPDGNTHEVVRSRNHEVPVFEHSPLAGAAELLAAELGATYAEVPAEVPDA